MTNFFKAKLCLLMVINLWVMQLFGANYTIASGDTLFTSDNSNLGLNSGDSLFVRGIMYMDASYYRYDDSVIYLIVTGSSAAIHWSADYTLNLGAGSTITFYNGGDLTYVSPCNNNKTIYFGSVLIAACNGGNQAVLNFDDVVSSGGVDENGVLLPVVWLYVKAELSPPYYEISWATAMEIGNNYFEIEGSKDQINWQNLAHIPSLAANGFSNDILYYQYRLDYGTQPGLSYFRIKQVDFDMNFEYSKILYIAQHTTAPYVLSYDRNFMQISTLRPTDNFEVILFGVNGQEMFKQSYTGQAKFELPKNTPVAVQISMNTQVEVIKVMKLD